MSDFWLGWTVATAFSCAANIALNLWMRRRPHDTQCAKEAPHRWLT